MDTVLDSISELYYNVVHFNGIDDQITKAVLSRCSFSQTSFSALMKLLLKIREH